MKAAVLPSAARLCAASPMAVRGQLDIRSVRCGLLIRCSSCELASSSTGTDAAAMPRLGAAIRQLGTTLSASATAIASCSSDCMRNLQRTLDTGRHGLPLLLSAAPVALSPLDQLTGNYVFAVGFCGWFLAQFLKIFTKWYKTGVFTLRAFVDSGGMPSSHSALCSSVTTAIALQQGLGSPLFAICTCFSVIVMYDAMGVRRHAGLQAEVLNAVVANLLDGDHPVSERKLKEVLGHTPRQVLCGAALGIIVGLLFPGPF